MESEVHSAFSALMEKLDKLLDRRPCGKLIRVESPVPSLDILSCLAIQQRRGQVKAYWSNRGGGLVVAGIASAWEYSLDSVTDIPIAFRAARKLMSSLSSNISARCFSYLSFSDKSSQIWPEFGYGKIWLPLVEISETGSGSILACNLLASSDCEWRRRILEIRQLLHKLLVGDNIDDNFFRIRQCRSYPGIKCWNELVSSALKHIDSGILHKVVLSKKISYRFDGCVSPWKIMKLWQESSEHIYSFVFEGTEEHYFLGCSPERLLKRYGRIISTEALAGTSPRGKGRDEDQRIAAELMSDSKNIHENKLVLNDIIAKLQLVCKWLKIDNSHSILKLKDVQHLRYRIRGELSSGIMDEDLVMRIHPTSAVGGDPGNEAHKFINDNEFYARGLYAGVCGIIGNDMTEFTVSIRSASLKPGSISLYSGAGIVHGSSSDSEWRELNYKTKAIQTILSSLQDSVLGCEGGYPFSLKK
ncbi:MAG: isochorismate synthase [Candidatus Endonucleobacter bathymodioli]|uniref:isochorismate synthase n=1 Tax=Candidatus Endonucleibacter bathymodioli TaxID=539814 RepID=A0AA90NTS0_9GAMM|nr:isochorismate synthase [Candidatus Endonucleobacter bathymodioli]